jgi:hypothetical protein
MEETGRSITLDAKTESKPPYVPPMIKLMEEKDLLAEFQVSVNAASWWGSF